MVPLFHDGLIVVELLYPSCMRIYMIIALENELWVAVFMLITLDTES